MKQYIDKSALVAEVNRLQDTTMDKNQNFLSSYHEGIFDGLSMIENFFDTIEVKEEPVSEDLEEAVENYAATGEVLPNGKVMINFQTEKAFRAGANWQKEHLIGKMEQFLYEELSNGDIECRDMKFLIEYLKLYMKEKLYERIR